MLIWVRELAAAKAALLFVLGELAVIWSQPVGDRSAVTNTHPASKREQLSMELTCPDGNSYA
jgi:hypothetical protein